MPDQLHPIRKSWIWLAAFLCVQAGGGILRPHACRADSTAKPPSTLLAKTQKNPSEKKEPKRSIIMNEVEIMGEVDKPKTMFIIPRAPHHYYQGEHKKDFTQEILAPTNKYEAENYQQWRETIQLP